jgi:succinate dehydrogenase / fumarate reductase membrane anchor subunit
MGNGTSIGKVRGLGSAHEGAHHWLVQRFTAIGNLVLMIWLIASFVMLPDLSYTTVTSWLSAPVPATAMVLLIVSTFWHARLGLQVLVEDYVQESGMKFGVTALLNLAAIGGGAFGIFAVARLALGGAA